MECNKIKEMSEQELKSHLVTCDYKGKEFKDKILEELLDRSFKRGYEQALTKTT